MKGCKAGLQAKVISVEKRAIYTHCVAYSASLLVQTILMKLLPSVNDFLMFMKDLIAFISSSAKRLEVFSQL